MTSDDQQQATEGDEESRGRRLLKGLRRIKAPADFEFRLQRRLVDERRKSRVRSVGSLAAMPLRIPIYAASLIAIVGVSFLAYYALIRTGVTPEEFSGPGERTETAPFADSLLLQEEGIPVDRDEQPAVLEKRSSRMHPRGEKAPSVTRSRESKDVGPGDDLRRQNGFQLAAPSKAAKTESEIQQDKKLDSNKAKQDSLDRTNEKEKQPPPEDE